MQIQGQGIHLAGHQVLGGRHRIALRAVESGTGYQRHASVRRDIGQTDKPIGQARVGRHLQR